MGLKLTNNAISRLASGITTASTSISLVPGDGAKFPALSAGDWFPATILKADGSYEVVKVTARATDVLTVTRAQENTTAKSFAAGDRIELRPTAAIFSTAIEAAQNSVRYDLDQALSNTQKAQARENIGLVDGTITVGPNWTVTEESGNLYFLFGNQKRGKLSQSGDLTVIGNITAYGTI